MNIESELKLINQKICHMFDLIQSACEKAFNYYLSNDKYDPELVIDDDEINEAERQIESLCMQILLRERLFASDMRIVTASLKLVEDLERIGDQAYDIKQMTDELKKVENKSKLEDVEKLIAMVEKMVTQALKAYVETDAQTAKELINNDDAVDSLFWNITQKLINLDEKHTLKSSQVIYQVFIVKYLERIADQATNIGEWVEYIVNGFHKDKVII